MSPTSDLKSLLPLAPGLLSAAAIRIRAAQDLTASALWLWPKGNTNLFPVLLAALKQTGILKRTLFNIKAVMVLT